MGRETPTPTPKAIFCLLIGRAPDSQELSFLFFIFVLRYYKVATIEENIK